MGNAETERLNHHQMKHHFILLLFYFSCFCSAQSNQKEIYTNSTYNLKSDKIPSQVFEMKELKELSIQGMDCDITNQECWTIKEIPKEIKRLKSIEKLQLNLNSISIVPKFLVELKALRILDLTDNPNLTDLSTVAELTNLEELYLFGCYLKDLPKNIGKLQKLKKLGLEGNDLSETEKNRIRSALPNCEISF